MPVAGWTRCGQVLQPRPDDIGRSGDDLRPFRASTLRARMDPVELVRSQRTDAQPVRAGTSGEGPDTRQQHRRAVQVAVAALREGRSWLEAADAADAVLR